MQKLRKETKKKKLELNNDIDSSNYDTIENTTITNFYDNNNITNSDANFIFVNNIDNFQFNNKNQYDDDFNEDDEIENDINDMDTYQIIDILSNEQIEDEYDNDESRKIGILMTFNSKE